MKVISSNIIDFLIAFSKGILCFSLISIPGVIWLGNHVAKLESDIERIEKKADAINYELSQSEIEELRSILKARNNKKINFKLPKQPVLSQKGSSLLEIDANLNLTNFQTKEVAGILNEFLIEGNVLSEFEIDKVESIILEDKLVLASAFDKKVFFEKRMAHKMDSRNIIILRKNRKYSNLLDLVALHTPTRTISVTFLPTDLANTKLGFIQFSKEHILNYKIDSLSSKDQKLRFIYSPYVGNELNQQGLQYFMSE